MTAVVNETRELMNRLLDITAWAGRDELRALLEGEIARLNSPASTVVVAGQEGKGKTSIINGLLACPGLLPVADAGGTATRTLVIHAPERTAQLVFDDNQPRTVPIDELGHWITARAGRTDATPLPQAAVVTVDAPILSTGLRLVDTPGVGGLTAAHARMTIATLPGADALLFVTDASSPLTSSELAFLHAAADRLDSVIIAVTKVDQFTGWETIVEANRALLSEHAPRLAHASVIPMSSWMLGVALGRESGDPLRERAMNDSGFVSLVAELQRGVIGRTACVRTANLLQVGRVVVDVLAEAERGRLLAASDESPATFEDQKEAMRRLAESSAQWRASLDTGIKRLAAEFDTELDWAFSELAQRFDTLAAAATMPAEEFAQSLQDELSTLWSNADALLTARLAELLGSVLGDVAADAGSLALGHLELPARVCERLKQDDPQQQRNGAENLLQYYPVIFSGGAAATFSSYLTEFFGVAVNPLQLAVAGVSVMGAMLGLRISVSRRARTRQESSRLARSALAQARSMIGKQTAAEFASFREAVEMEVARQIGLRRDEIEDRIEQQRAFASDTERRQKEADIARRRLANLDDFGRRLNDLGIAARAELASPTTELAGDLR